MKPQTCAHCGSVSDNFMDIEAGMRVALSEAGIKDLPEKVCASCYEKLAGSVSQGLKLRLERDAREKNKMIMWKNRVHLIRNARNLMNQKAYSEAAVQYEKYLRVLEMVYNLKKGELSPAVFNNSVRSKELTVVASVYWDLLRIYDTNQRYAERMHQSAQKLAQFLPFSQIYPDVMKKADQFAKTAKNQSVVRMFLKQTKSRRGPCFIADAAFASEPDALTPHLLRAFRDQHLRTRKWGRWAVAAYYRGSPPVARYIARHPAMAALTRRTLSAIATRLVKITGSAAPPFSSDR